MQAFPPPGEKTEEFYISGCAETIPDPAIRQAVIDEEKIIAGDDEVLFELMLDRVMHTRLENWGTPDERPVHRKWRAGI